MRAIKRQHFIQNTSNPSLLDTLPLWLTTPEEAFTVWIGNQGHRRSTRIVYHAMFNRFCAWLRESNKALDQREATDIARFLDTANPNLPPSRRTHYQLSRQRQQYFRLLSPEPGPAGGL